MSQKKSYLVLVSLFCLESFLVVVYLVAPLFSFFIKCPLFLHFGRRVVEPSELKINFITILLQEYMYLDLLNDECEPGARLLTGHLDW